MRKGNKLNALVVLLGGSALTLGLAATGGTAWAGHGGSPIDIRNAIAANSVDSIQAELEHAEYLVCSACTDMVTPLIDHTDYRVRRVAAWWLVRRASARTVYVNMLNRLAQPDSTLARNAADVLGEFGYPSAIAPLGAALSNPVFSGEARAAMAQALGSIGRTEASVPLVSALTASDPLVRAAAVKALTTVRGFRDTSVAAPLLADPDLLVRAAAAGAIGSLHTQGAGVVDGLVQAVASDPSALVRRRAAWALGEVGAPSSAAGSTLQAAASSDPNPLVRSLAQVALSKLTR